MLKERPAVFYHLHLVCDLAIMVCSFVLVHLLSDFDIKSSLWVLLFFVPLWWFFAGFQRVYESHRISKIVAETVGIVKVVAKSVLVVMVLNFTFISLRVDYSLIIGFGLITAVLLICFRMSVRVFLRFIRMRGYNYRNFVLVGTGKEAEEVLSLVNHFKYWGIKILGVVSLNSLKKGDYFKGHRILGTKDDLEFIVHNSFVDGVIFASRLQYLKYLDNAMTLCEEEGITMYIASDFLRRRVAKTYLEDVAGTPFLSFSTVPRNTPMLMIKRAVDIVISSLLCLLLSPIFIIVSVLIKFTSPGPVFFEQERIGLYGRRFTLLKFRTMVNGAEAMKEKLREKNELDGPVFKIANDPRVTRLGKILRKLSLDELPQLINVLKGDMSLVGPRPAVPGEVNQYKPYQRRRFSIRPGITCIWQVNGRNHIAFDDWVKLDLHYIDNWSIGLDFKILFKTIPAALSGKGAS
ncbi:MAG: sugar transferase [Candidatus Omnitrophica bacterium]|nr:sugar transferase [Candidatus Omnitrophota bacterium]